METRELLKKVRQIEIKTRGMVNHLFSGEYKSVFKGRGMAFSEVREYQFGDDIRSLDWNVSARLDHPFVKVFEEERELTVMLVVDFSRSGNFGSVAQTKNEIAAEICAVLAFSAIKNNARKWPMHCWAPIPNGFCSGFFPTDWWNCSLPCACKSFCASRESRSDRSDCWPWS